MATAIRPLPPVQKYLKQNSNIFYRTRRKEVNAAPVILPLIRVSGFSIVSGDYYMTEYVDFVNVVSRGSRSAYVASMCAMLACQGG